MFLKRNVIRFLSTQITYTDQSSLQGFPSGHAANSFASAIFLVLYMNGKLKAFADYAADFWVLVVTLTPLIGASLIAATMYTSYVRIPHLRWL